MNQLVIHGIAQSNFVWAVRIAIAEKGLDHALVADPPHAGPVAAIHPLGKVPVLVHGDVRLFESRAIVGYVDAAFDGPALVARDRVRAAQQEAWVSLIITSIDPVLVRRYLFAFLFPGTEDGAPNAAAMKECRDDVARHLGVLDRAVSEGHILGEDFALPDAWAIPILAYLSRLPTWSELSAPFPTLADANQRALQRASVVATTPPPLPA